AMNAFFVARHRLEAGQEQLSAGLGRQELALIEAREGKSRRWHLRRIGIAATAAIDAMPHDRNAADMGEFSRAIVALADAARDYEEASKTSARSMGQTRGIWWQNSVRCAKRSRKRAPATPIFRMLLTSTTLSSAG